MSKDSQEAASDPRVYFAAERTLLAWIRTGLAVIGVGFLVARFGLFLRLVRGPSETLERPFVSSLIGVGFILLGAFMIAFAGWQHKRYVGQMTLDSKPQHYKIGFSLWISALIAVLGAALAAYLGYSVLATSA